MPHAAAAVVLDGDTVATGGFVISLPEGLAAALEQRCPTTAAPCDLTLVYAAGQGAGKFRGLKTPAGGVST